MNLKNLFNFNKNENSISKKCNISNKEHITFNQLKCFQVNVRTELVPENPGAIVVTRLQSTSEDKSISFRVEMLEGESWSPHIHDCWEVIVMFKGECVDKISNKTINVKQQMIIKPNTWHEIECTSPYAVFYVEFYKKP